MHDGNNADQTAATPAEGVRILGAEEAQAALAGERRPPANEQTALDLPVEERDESARASENATTWSASEQGDAPDAPADAPPVEVPPLPHWTEPPTGAVPAIFSDDTGEHETETDLDAWATISGSQPRFRAEGADWAEADFAPDEFETNEEPLGALGEQGPIDDEAAFAEALDERRRRPARNREQQTRVARPPRAPEGEMAPPGPAAARDLPTAILTAAVLVVAALVCFELGPWATTVLAAFVVGLASLELSNSLQRKGFRGAVPLVLLASFTMPLAAQHYGIAAYPIYFALVVIASMLWFLWEVTPGRPLVGVASTVFSFAYVGGLGGFAGLLLAAPHDWGVGLILGVAICSIAYDVVGFFVGSQFGRSRIAPSVSPNKTVAGTVGGMGAAIIFGWLAAGAIAPWTHGRGFVLGVLVAVGAFLGDLSESMIKRDLGLKDFGSLLPGHGGIMDRFDGLLFCLPIGYYLALHWRLV